MPVEMNSALKAFLLLFYYVDPVKCLVNESKMMQSDVL